MRPCAPVGPERRQRFVARGQGRKKALDTAMNRRAAGITDCCHHMYRSRDHLQLPTYLSVCLSIYLSVCLSVCPPVLCLCLSACQSAMSVCLSICPLSASRAFHFRRVGAFSTFGWALVWSACPHGTAVVTRSLSLTRSDDGANSYNSWIVPGPVRAPPGVDEMTPSPGEGVVVHAATQPRHPFLLGR